MKTTLNSLSISATLHCLTGCAIGEIIGMTITTILGLATVPSIAIAVALAFLFGYSLSIMPLLRSGMTFRAAAPVILAADSISILTMEIVDNGVITVIPGAMHAGLVNPIYWLSMSFALFIAFWAALPVNRYLLQKGKGHALVHQYHHRED